MMSGGINPSFGVIWAPNVEIFNMKKILLPVCFLAAALSGRAQEKVYTAADYERAENMLNYNTGPLIDRAEVRANWVEGDKCWYRVMTSTGSELVLVDPV